MKCERYGLYWVDLNPVIGSEMAKVRPAVVVSDDLMNQYLNTVVICPVTSTLHPKWRSRVSFVSRGRKAEIAIDQIRTVSKQRIRDKLTQLSPRKAQEIRSVISEMYATA
jgi:mRNA interferase MazF